MHYAPHSRERAGVSQVSAPSGGTNTPRPSQVSDRPRIKSNSCATAKLPLRCTNSHSKAASRGSCGRSSGGTARVVAARVNDGRSDDEEGRDGRDGLSGQRIGGLKALGLPVRNRVVPRLSQNKGF
jgi:hypothetical protein